MGCSSRASEANEGKLQLALRRIIAVISTRLLYQLQTNIRVEAQLSQELVGIRQMNGLPLNDLQVSAEIASALFQLLEPKSTARLVESLAADRSGNNGLKFRLASPPSASPRPLKLAKAAERSPNRPSPAVYGSVSVR